MNIPILNFIDTGFGGHLAYVTLDAAVAQNWYVTINGSTPQGDPVDTKYVVVDNTGNNAVFYVDYGGIKYSVSPYTRKTFPIFNHQGRIGFSITLNYVSLTFCDFDPGLPEDTNQVATSNPGGGGIVNPAIWTLTKPPSVLTLSPDSLTVFNTVNNHGGSVWNSAVIAKAQSTGKYYHEITVNSVVVGMGYSSLPGPLQSYNGDIAQTSVGHFFTGWWQFNGANLFQTGYIYQGTGDQYGMACDLDMRRVWLTRLGSGTWNGYSGTAPGDAVTGLDISGIGAVPIVPICSVSEEDGKQNLTANFGATLFTGQIPTGYGKWPLS